MVYTLKSWILTLFIYILKGNADKRENKMFTEFFLKQTGGKSTKNLTFSAVQGFLEEQDARFNSRIPVPVEVISELGK